MAHAKAIVDAFAGIEAVIEPAPDKTVAVLFEPPIPAADHCLSVSGRPLVKSGSRKAKCRTSYLCSDGYRLRRVDQGMTITSRRTDDLGAFCDANIKPLAPVDADVGRRQL
ncbi:hypothetical protein AOA14_08880 [Sphingopyxis terrae subsp. terrae NBRC 15098]|uniref:Uncharacterized protein n=1 Tax=Sphingopyxis terrae subsp. terrae NBRC 15098 TaxID=1219058 RepID=A0A142VYB1_9SPHN|nr:hypothetical protein AOA14_08880 [Sphingopyxis terrae subsp. terrae NBRC 15098]